MMSENKIWNLIKEFEEDVKCGVYTEEEQKIIIDKITLLEMVLEV